MYINKIEEKHIVPAKFSQPFWSQFFFCQAILLFIRIHEKEFSCGNIINETNRVARKPGFGVFDQTSNKSAQFALNTSLSLDILDRGDSVDTQPDMHHCFSFMQTSNFLVT